MSVPILNTEEVVGLQTSLYRSYPFLPGDPVYSLDTDTVRIGRSSACEIFLQDHSASRVHAQIRADGGSYIVVDDKSTNGTFVNGIRVNESRLDHRDVIFLGNSVFRVINHRDDGDLQRQISYLRAVSYTHLTLADE